MLCIGFSFIEPLTSLNERKDFGGGAPPIRQMFALRFHRPYPIPEPEKQKCPIGQRVFYPAGPVGPIEKRSM